MPTEPEGAPILAGLPGNAAHEPRKADKEGKGSIGDKALMDAVILVGLCWLFLLFLAYSLRHHNI